MDKVQVNNQIVTMRKNVRRAKVQVIGKLVKTIRFLKNKKGDEEKISKFRRKAERLTEELALIKKIPLDDISKHCLSCSKDWREVLAQKNASLEERTIAKLCNHKILKQCTQEFYEKSPTLRPRIDFLLQNWKNKSKTFQRNAVESQNISDETSIKTEVSFEDINLEETNVKTEVSFEDINLGGSNIRTEVSSEDINLVDSTPGSSSCPDHNSQEKDNCSKKPEEHNVKRKAFKKALKDRKLVTRPDVTNAVPSQNVTARIEGSLEIKPLNFNELEGKDVILLTGAQERISDFQKDPEPEGEATKSDPFFLGSDGKEITDDDEVGDTEMSDADLVNESGHTYNKHSQFVGKLSADSYARQRFNNSPRYKKENKCFRSEKFDNIKGNRVKKFPEQYFRRGSSKMQYHQKSSWSPRHEDHRSKRGREGGFKQSYATKNYDNTHQKQYSQTTKGFKEVLHPSWEAKRKLKMKGQTLIPFQGKKIKFDE